MKNLMKLLAVLALILPTMAIAQNIETVPGPYLIATPSSPYGLQNYRYDCDNTTPTSGRCWPLVTLFDGTNLGVVNPNGQAAANNSAPVVLPSTQVSTDPCALQIKKTVPISFTTASIIQPVAPQASPPAQIYICGIILNPDIADRISIFEGTGGTCAGGSPFALLGGLGTTLSTGMSVGATLGFAYGNGGYSVFTTKFSGDGFCIGHTITSSQTIAGSLEYIQQ